MWRFPLENIPICAIDIRSQILCKYKSIIAMWEYAFQGDYLFEEKPDLLDLVEIFDHHVDDWIAL